MLSIIACLISSSLLSLFSSKIPSKVREIICVILAILFLADSAYSSINPNVGAGITDDANRTHITQEETK